jgi:NADPH-dependent glutamate synthase beta subunit-like oxidoreductase
MRLRNICGAIRTIKENNILGGVCGVLCPSDRFCEKECSATGIDRAIRIAKLQRFLIEHSWKVGFKPFANPRFELPKPLKYKVAIIGAGPAGLSCAAELAKHGYQVTVFEERPEPGGMLRYGIPGFRLSGEFFKKEFEDIKSLKVIFKYSKKIAGPNCAEKLLKKGFNAVFISIGLWSSIRPPFNHTGSGVITSVRFLEMFSNRKLVELRKLCARKTVTVLGGGSVAIDCARTALRLGAKDVYLIYRRSFSQMPAEKQDMVEALNEGIHFIVLNQPIGYVRDSHGNLKGISLIRTRLSGKDSSGRPKPINIKGSEWVLEAEVCIEAIGNQPEKNSISIGKLIMADSKTLRTSKAGIFAGGDIVRGPGTVVQAVSDGKIAAMSIMKYLSKKHASKGRIYCLKK